MILVVAEQRQGELSRTSWEAVAAAQQIGPPVTAVVVGSGVGAAAAALAAADLAEVLVLDEPALAAYTADGWVQALTGIIQAEQPTLVILPHTYQTRDFVPALAVSLDRALLTDCTRSVRRDGELAFSRQMFQGKLMADVVPLGPPPHLVTFQSGAVSADAVVKGASPAASRTVSVAVDSAAIRQHPEPAFQEARHAVDLSKAERIVAVGRGIKGEEHLESVRRLAAAMGAEVAASRPICDAGWLPMDRQVGSSGQTVAPTLYLALGISGAIQHVVGMKGARTIVAVNKDADAPIFEIADYGFVGDLFEFVPAMIAEVEG